MGGGVCYAKSVTTTARKVSALDSNSTQTVQRITVSIAGTLLRTTTTASTSPKT